MSTPAEQVKQFTLDESEIRWRFTCSMYGGTEDEVLEAVYREAKRKYELSKRVLGDWE